MQAACHWNGDNLIAVRVDNLPKLANAFGVATLGQSHKKLAADTQDIPAFECSGELDVGELPGTLQVGDAARLGRTADVGSSKRGRAGARSPLNEGGR